jgi:hypothetical protein
MTSTTHGRRADPRPEQYKRTGLWVIYENPSDYPGKFVARWWQLAVLPSEPGAVYVPTSEKHVEDTLDAVRARIGSGFAYFARMPGDDPVIVEVWI